MTTVTITKPFEQIVRKAAAQLEQIAREETAIQSRYHALQAERERIAQYTTERAQRLADLLGKGCKLQEAVTQAESYAALAQGTPGEQKSIIALKEVRAQLAAAQRELEQTEAQSRKEETHEAHRLATLEEQSATCQRTMLDLQARRATLEAGRVQAEQEHQQSLLRGMVTRLQASQAAIDARRKDVTEAQLAMEELRDEARALVQQYPALRERLAPWLQTNDATIRFLERAIALYGSLLNEGEGVAIDSDLLKQVSPWMGHVVELLRLDTTDLWPISTHRPAEALTIRDRHEQFEKLLELYKKQQQQA